MVKLFSLKHITDKIQTYSIYREKKESCGKIISHQHNLSCGPLERGMDKNVWIQTSAELLEIKLAAETAGKKSFIIVQTLFTIRKTF